jgi:hypothetical protein
MVDDSGKGGQPGRCVNRERERERRVSTSAGYDQRIASLELLRSAHLDHIQVALARNLLQHRLMFRKRTLQRYG